MNVFHLATLQPDIKGKVVGVEGKIERLLPPGERREGANKVEAGRRMQRSRCKRARAAEFKRQLGKLVVRCSRVARRAVGGALISAGARGKPACRFHLAVK